MSKIVYNNLKQQIPLINSKLKEYNNGKYILTKDDISEISEILICVELLFKEHENLSDFKVYND